MKRGLGLVICAVSMWPAAAAQATPPPLEYEVKAAFLLNFTKFIEWPSSTFRSASAPFRICITGENPFGNSLSRIVQGEHVNSHPLKVVRLQRERASECQIIYFDRREKTATELIPRLGNGVLAIGETADFLEIGGVIRFILENNRVRFDINQIAARRAGLEISSRLLKVARYVEGGD